MRPSLLALAACLVASLLAGCGAPAEDLPVYQAPSASAEPAPATTLPDPVPDADGKVRLSEDEWRARLTPEQYRILRGAATERPFSCPLWRISDQPGVYHCAGCGLALFDSADKFDSGTGWPSFAKPVAPGRVAEKADHSHGMIRVETLCARCDGHLGHVFPDGPSPGGLRYCINGSVLRFAPKTEPRPDASAKAQP